MLRHIPMYLSALGNEPYTTTSGVSHSLGMVREGPGVGRGWENIIHPCVTSKKTKAKAVRRCLFPQTTQTFRVSHFRVGVGREGENCFSGCTHMLASEKDFRKVIFFHVDKPFFHNLTTTLMDTKDSDRMKFKAASEVEFFWNWKVKM